MSEETSKKPQTISRDDLYRQVWQTPASRLCAQYGISGRGLKKICDRLNVPPRAVNRPSRARRRRAYVCHDAVDLAFVKCSIAASQITVSNGPAGNFSGYP